MVAPYILKKHFKTRIMQTYYKREHMKWKPYILRKLTFKEKGHNSNTGTSQERFKLRFFNNKIKHLRMRALSHSLSIEFLIGFVKLLQIYININTDSETKLKPNSTSFFEM